MTEMDSILETKKFQLYAEKADTEEKRIELCMKYLKHKGVAVDTTPTIKPHETIIQDTKDHVRLMGRETIDIYKAESLGPEYHATMKKQCVGHIIEHITEQITQNDLIRFETMRDYMRNQLVIHGTLYVWKGPNK